MNLNRMRIGVFCTAAMVAPSMMFAQTGQPGSMPATPSPQSPGGSAGPGMAGAMTGTAGAGSPEGQMMKDKMFLRKAAEGGMAEVQMGQLAAQKGSSSDVKSFGQKMVDDHTTLNESMKPIAMSMGVTAPAKLSKMDQMEYDKLNSLSGDDFDKEYLTAMVQDHHKDMREFRMESMSAGDPALKEAVTKGLGVIREHTRMVDDLAKAKGIPVPERRGGNGAPPPPPAQ